MDAAVEEEEEEEIEGAEPMETMPMVGMVAETMEDMVELPEVEEEVCCRVRNTSHRLFISYTLASLTSKRVWEMKRRRPVFRSLVCCTIRWDVINILISDGGYGGYGGGGGGGYEGSYGGYGGGGGGGDYGKILLM